jgi:hypothetical protein
MRYGRDSLNFDPFPQKKRYVVSANRQRALATDLVQWIYPSICDEANVFPVRWSATIAVGEPGMRNG